MNQHEQDSGAFDADIVRYIAEQVAELVAPLDDDQLTAVFAEVRVIVARDQASIEAHRAEQEGKLRRLLGD